MIKNLYKNTKKYQILIKILRAPHEPMLFCIYNPLFDILPPLTLWGAATGLYCEYTKVAYIYPCIYTVHKYKYGP